MPGANVPPSLVIISSPGCIPQTVAFAIDFPTNGTLDTTPTPPVKPIKLPAMSP